MEKKHFWTSFVLFAILFLERFAYTNLLIQLPIYIAQKGIENTLGWGQEVKGWIFFFWALVQNLTPIFFGAISDRISPQRAITLSLICTTIGYLGLIFQNGIVWFIIFIIFIGFGSGWFKPSLQSLFSTLTSRVVWAFYLLVGNIAFLSAIILSKFLKDIGWEFVFITSLIISAINFLLSWFSLYPKEKILDKTFSIKIALNEFKEIFRLLNDRKLVLILAFTTCFAMIYMQFYESLPNFIVDWVDTSKLVEFFKLPDSLTMNTSLGKQVSYEIFYILNPLLILFFVLPLQKFTLHKTIVNSIAIALILVTLGFSICGFTKYGEFLLIGFVVYTFGEMLFNMKILELIGKIAPKEKKSTYFGLLNVSYTIGLTTGALAGGYLYKQIAEKYSLALKYLGKVYTNDPIGEIAMKIHDIDPTSFLWNLYKPYLYWLPFIIIGIIGILNIVVFKKYYFNKIVNNGGKNK
ncbi:MAG: hypothetical protein CH6_3407 [Candidatus Kapaibacterium sp.]|nr:MAG: hypothetical protein CH6_3407 [Candidatus Kapabacteria bacterium]